MCKLSSLTDFTVHIAKKLLVYADLLDRQDGSTTQTPDTLQGDMIPDTTAATKSAAPARYRMLFFITDIGGTLRMDNTLHLTTPMLTMNYCILCSSTLN